MVASMPSRHQVVVLVLVVLGSLVAVPAMSALTYSAVLPFDYGVWTSYYQRVETSDSVTYNTAGPMCETLGAGWGLAGVYSAAATTSILSSGILDNARGYSGYFAAMVPPDPSSKSLNRYVYTYGRYKGLAMSEGSGTSVTCKHPGLYCNYNTGEPNMLACTNGYDGYQHANQIYPTGKWDDIEPTDCGAPYRNAAFCERATCAISLDCIEANTASITPGLYVPNCVCVCKTGFRGAMCQVTTASYFEDGREFAGWCEKDAFDPDGAEQRCASQGPEWTLPSITSATISSNLATKIGEVFWSSGRIDAVTVKHAWRKGRYDGHVFSSGLYPSTPVMYTNWGANQPDHSTCNGFEPAETDVSVRTDGAWNDLWSNGCGWLRSREVRCYACERSLCLMSDCPPRTSHVSGYFPSCVCQTETMTPTATSSVADTISVSATNSLSRIDTSSASVPDSTSVSQTQLTPTISTPPTDTSTASTTASVVMTSSKSVSSTATAIVTLSLSGTATGASHTHSQLVTSTQTLAHTRSVSLAPTTTTTWTVAGSLSQNTASTSASHTSLPTETQSALMTASMSLLATITTSLPSTMTLPPTHTAPQSHSVTVSESQSLTPTHDATSTASTTISAPVTVTVSVAATPTPSIQPTPSQPHTLTLPPTATHSHTHSAPTRSAVSTPTVPHTHTPTYAPNTTLIEQLIRDLPLFGAISVIEADVRIGRSTDRMVTAVSLYELLRVSASRRATLAVPIITTRATLGSVGVTGNPEGFFKTAPMVDVVLWSPSNVTVTLGSIASYAISVGEGVELYTSLRGLLGRDADLLGSSHDTDAPLLVGRITAVPDDEGESGPSIVTSVVTGGAGVAGGMAAELQGIGALAMMGCSDPNTKSSFGSYRVLSPVAVQDSYAGVIIGNALLALVVGVVQACMVGVLRACQRVRRTIDLMAMARFPAFLIAALLAFQTGTAYSSSQLISRAGDFEAWEVFVGTVGFAFSLLLPVFLALHPYLRIGRAYQEYEMSEWLVSKGLPTWVVWVIPRGAMFSPETRRAFGGYVSSYRAPPRQLFWTSLPTWTPLVFLVSGLFHPETVPGCQALFVCMGAVMIAMGVLVVWRAPMRTDLGGWLDAASRVLLGCTMFCMAAALVADDSANVVAPAAVFWLAVGLMFCTVLRVVHRFVCWYADRCIQADAVPLSTVWTHIPGASHKVTHQFTTHGDALLDVEELSRDRDMEVDNKSDCELEDVVVDAPDVPSLEEDDTVPLPYHSDDSIPTEHSTASSSSTLGNSLDDSLATTSSDSTLELTPTPLTTTPITPTVTASSSHSSIAFSSSSSSSSSTSSHGSSLDLL